MNVEPTEKLNRRHIGRNVQRVRMYFGVKQETLAADLNISQPEVSKIEQQDEIEDELLSRIADVLGISPEVIRDFDVEKAIYNINNIRDNTFEQAFTSISQLEYGATSVTQQINNPLDKIVELYERLLKSEREKIELLKNR
ncbi:MAG: helix-turn-helix domain-containing protein [Proteiniphilum sp.]|jgi:transcriptional regulator with XRE-family HTH domain|nr:helix-turn-helix domain-containing protein [Proteiniphilum sp.]